MKNQMRVIKRNGSEEEVSFDKVIWRIKKQCLMEPTLNNIDPIKIAQKVCSNIYDKVSTAELDELTAQICTSKITQHIDFGKLASRIIISNNHKLTSPSFSETIYLLYTNTNNGEKNPLISKNLYEIVMKNKDKLNSYIDYSRDYLFDYFGFKTLEKAYLIKINNQIVERISHMFLRVALGLHGCDIRSALETYDYMSQKYFTHATPTLFHSGTERPQLLSCFLFGIEDSVDGIYKSISDCAKISKWAGGIGVWAHEVRGNNSTIRSTNGKSNGIIPMLRVFNDTARHINQSGKRNGSFAFYLEPWHTDIMEFLDAKKNHGDENARARDLFYALWIPDLFMEKVEKNEDWYLMCPDLCKGLTNVYGEKFKILYNKYCNDDTIPKKKIKAQELWKKVLVSQIETGTPYMLYKDSANSKSNQQNLGTIKSSNLCTEIIEYSDKDQYACCTLASIGLPKFIDEFDFSTIENLVIYSKPDCKYCKYSKNYLNNLNLSYLDKDINDKSNLEELKSLIGDEFKTVPQIFIKYKNNTKNEYIGGFDQLVVCFKPKYNFKKLGKVCRVVTRNLNKVIDINYYPVKETRYSNKLHRPLGIGVQGLSDVYSQMRISFDSDEAKLLNKQIFATIYYFSMLESNNIAISRRESMLKIKSILKNKQRVKANEYIKVSDKQKWLSGNKFVNDIDLNELSQSEKEEVKLLVQNMSPIDEELFMENEQYIGAYSSFDGSPLSKGKFQFDLWNKTPLNSVPECIFEWDILREKIIKFGVRNSLLLAPMPTASTSQILGNNECIEPLTSNIYSRRTIAGNFIIVNKYLLNDLISINLWSNTIKDEIIRNGGSIINIESIPKVFQNLYKTSWNLSQKTLIDQSADRGIYICQSQSLNLWLENPDFQKLSSMHMYTWKKGLKTGLYYLRTKSAAKAQQFTIEPEPESEACEMCSS